MVAASSCSTPSFSSLRSAWIRSWVAVWKGLSASCSSGSALLPSESTFAYRDSASAGVISSPSASRASASEPTTTLGTVGMSMPTACWAQPQVV